jgi:hypothetical protein
VGFVTTGSFAGSELDDEHEDHGDGFRKVYQLVIGE